MHTITITTTQVLEMEAGQSVKSGRGGQSSLPDPQCAHLAWLLLRLPLSSLARTGQDTFARRCFIYLYIFLLTAEID